MYVVTSQCNKNVADKIVTALFVCMGYLFWPLTKNHRMTWPLFSLKLSYQSEKPTMYWLPKWGLLGLLEQQVEVFPYLRTAVSNHWTGLLDWNTELDYWTTFFDKFLGLFCYIIGDLVPRDLIHFFWWLEFSLFLKFFMQIHAYVSSHVIITITWATRQCNNVCRWHSCVCLLYPVMPKH